MSPWFYIFSPGAWAAKTGAFNFLMCIAVGEDLIDDCPENYRRAIIAHECGHLAEFHWLLWVLAFLYLFHNSVVATVLGSATLWAASGAGVTAGLAAAATGLGLMTGLFYLMLRWFEYRADDYAVRRVSVEEMTGALAWLQTRLFDGKKIAGIETRIARLQRNHYRQLADNSPRGRSGIPANLV